ncbi:xylulokinase [Volucribacter amazonae]|uniref:ATPase n=1 Tax=Volucribacter amazonae TaxID=256731 RepID=A0A9X4SMC0_9PAST|nr:FGGY-family carbohydrate kinase [Volucribacter amazonae]MDG6895948.1 ATPase [Volucribacter amazonae]
MQKEKEIIDSGQAIIGIELGSTRIKSVMINSKGKILAIGIAEWENDFIDNIWTYSQQEIWKKLQESYLNLVKTVKDKYHTNIIKVKSIGISAMMHGYLPFDKQGNQLVPFRTWRNNITARAADKLTSLFQYPIPQRWSIAHLYNAILNNEPHIQKIDYITTLSGYVHWQLTGEKCLGIGDASGMFPIDTKYFSYNQKMIELFERKVTNLKLNWKLKDILPKVLVAGKPAGVLTKQGARLLDPTGYLEAGIPLCPPEGDAGTGMIATNCIKEKMGNISAGTSAFAMVVLNKPLSQVYSELDIVTTPAGKLVAMAHSNNCSSHINSWVSLFSECLQHFGITVYNEELYETLFLQALQGDNDCGNLLSYGFLSGEHNLGLSEGCRIFIHPTHGHFNLANFIRVQLYTAFAAMKLGMDILIEQEKVEINHILGHGGIFKTENVAQKILASALNIPLATTNTASNGGAWGIALLANFIDKLYQNESLEYYLDNYIFANTALNLIEPDEQIIKGYKAFMKRYKKAIPVVKTAIDVGVNR